jgi:predicted nucleotidyltransferase
VKKLEENRDTILHFGVRQIGIFGSYVRGEQTQASYLDFLLKFDSLIDEFYLAWAGYNE